MSNKLFFEKESNVSVIQYDKMGKLIAKFKSVSEASRKTGLYASNIFACIGGRLKTTGGFVWKSNSKYFVPDIFDMI